MRLRAAIAFVFATIVLAPVHAQEKQSAPVFEAASIRPSNKNISMCYSALPPGGTHFTVTCLSLRNYISWAWNVKGDDIQGGDSHALDTSYDISAVTSDGQPWTQDNIEPMLRQLLAERFHIAVHTGSKQESGYILTVDKGGPKLKPSEIDATKLQVKAGEYSQSFFMRGRIFSRGTPVVTVASMLSLSLKVPVIDRTGITGTYDVDLHFAPENSTDTTWPDLFTAVEQQLGLKLQRDKVTVDTLVVDYVDSEPTEN